MDFVELIQKYQEGTTPEQMKAITIVIGKFVAKHATEEELHQLWVSRKLLGINLCQSTEIISFAAWNRDI